jgi:hypothetical protein
MWISLLMLAAFVWFSIGTIANRDATQPWLKRYNFVSAGLAAWSLSVLIGRFYPNA